MTVGSERPQLGRRRWGSGKRGWTSPCGGRGQLLLCIREERGKLRETRETANIGVARSADLLREKPPPCALLGSMEGQQKLRLLMQNSSDVPAHSFGIRPRSEFEVTGRNLLFARPSAQDPVKLRKLSSIVVLRSEEAGEFPPLGHACCALFQPLSLSSS